MSGLYFLFDCMVILALIALIDPIKNYIKSEIIGEIAYIKKHKVAHILLAVVMIATTIMAVVLQK